MVATVGTLIEIYIAQKALIDLLLGALNLGNDLMHHKNISCLVA